jgi:hypothetical protein
MAGESAAIPTTTVSVSREAAEVAYSMLLEQRAELQRRLRDVNALVHDLGEGLAAVRGPADAGA